jgi:hypothetical protein
MPTMFITRVRLDGHFYPIPATPGQSLWFLTGEFFKPAA